MICVDSEMSGETVAGRPDAGGLKTGELEAGGLGVRCRLRSLRRRQCGGWWARSLRSCSGEGFRFELGFRPRRSDAGARDSDVSQSRSRAVGLVFT